MPNHLQELYNQAIEAVDTTRNKSEGLPLPDLLERVRLAHNALQEARSIEQASLPPTIFADTKLWERAVTKLQPSEREYPELGKWYGRLMLHIVHILDAEVSKVRGLNLPLDEKLDLMPVTSPAGLQDDTLIDIDDEGVEGSDVSFMKLIYPQLDAARGKIWACGGVKGAIIAAGPVDLKGLYYQTEFALYILKYKKEPTGQSLIACQKRAQARIDMVQPFIDDNQTLAGIQFVLNEKGNLDWVPITRSKQ